MDWLRRSWKKIVLTFVVLAVFVVTIVLPYALVRMVTSAGTRPMDLRLTSSPADYGLDFEDVGFTAADGVSLRGWYLGGEPTAVTVACGHGLFRSRREVLDRAAFFRRLGYNTLVFDFRRHGQSEGERVTMGYAERQDFAGAVDYLREKNPGSQVVLYGVSMGAAAALLAGRDRADVDAVIADSPFLSFEHTVLHHLDLVFGLPRFPIGSALLFFFERRAGFDREDFDLERAVADSGDRPTLILAGADDTRMPEELQRRVAEASRSSASRFESFAGARHGRAYESDAARYERVVQEFLREAGVARRPGPQLPPVGGDSSPGSR